MTEEIQNFVTIDDRGHILWTQIILGERADYEVSSPFRRRHIYAWLSEGGNEWQVCNGGATRGWALEWPDFDTVQDAAKWFAKAVRGRFYKTRKRFDMALEHASN